MHKLLINIIIILTILINIFIILIFQVEVNDKITIEELLDIDNNVLSTILKIFSNLSSEILYFKNDVKVKLFNSILYYEQCGKIKMLFNYLIS